MSAHGWLAEDAYAALQHHRQLLETIGTTNEDTTRLRAIDTVLFDVLRWDKARTETEKYLRAEGYADYVFGNEPAFVIVLEAKRAGDTFLLSPEVPADRPVPFDLLARESSSAADALRQAAGYAVQLGATYTAISNGRQWIITLTFVQGKPIQSRQVRAFASLEHICTHFRSFWDAFSPLALDTYLPSVSLLDSRFDPAPPKLSARIVNYPEPADRNILRNELSTVIEPLWANVTQRDEDEAFLRFCYIVPQDSPDDLILAKQLIQEAAVDETSEAVLAEGVGEVTALFRDTSAIVRKPVVVLGRIGHGKSIFLQYLRRVDSATQLRNYIQIDINFLDRPDCVEEVPSYIYREIDRQLLETYDIDATSDALARAVLNLELVRFRQSPVAKAAEGNQADMLKLEAAKLHELQCQQHDYFQSVFRHLRRGQKKAVAIFFDNLDRQDDRIQEAAFLRASAMARDWDALLFICIRPGTFQRSRMDGVLDAVAPRVIVVSPPRTDTMLRRRFEYAATLAQKSADLAGEGPKGAGAQAELLKGKRFFEICHDSIRRNRELAHLFASVANGNARSILQHVQRVILSGHLDTQKMLRIAEAQGRYELAVHESMRALLYLDYKQYDPNTSMFVNLFDVEHAEPKEHFSRLLALDFFARAAIGAAGHGYCARSSAEGYLHSVGYPGPHIAQVIAVLYTRKCLEGRVLDVPLADAGDDLRITALGRYHLTDLVRTFVYCDAIIVDTPILDRDLARSMAEPLSLPQRLRRSREFLHYLRRCAQELTDSNAHTLWEGIHDAIEADVRRVEEEIRGT